MKLMKQMGIFTLLATFLFALPACENRQEEKAEAIEDRAEEVADETEGVAEEKAEAIEEKADEAE